MEDDLFDETIWTPPDSLPDLSDEKLICIDVETKDPNLISKGPGWSRDDGYLIGIAVATENWQAYLPIAHDSFGNMSKDERGQVAQGAAEPWHGCRVP